METKPIRIEIQSVADRSRVLVDGQDISSVIRKITIIAEAGDVTKVTFDCFKLDSEPWVIEGLLLEPQPEGEQHTSEEPTS